MSTRPPVVEVIDPIQVDALRKQPPQQRLLIAAGMWETARVMLQGTLTQQHPEWSEERLNREIARRMCHRDIRSLYE